MAHRKKALSRYSTSDNDGTDQTSFYSYATKDTAAEALTDGYFNNSRETLRKGDVIHTSADIGAEPEYLAIVIMSVPDAGDITTSA